MSLLFLLYEVGRGNKMLEMKAIDKSYGKKHILQSIHLSIEEGVCYGLVGPNGAGKSTIMKIIAGIIHADHGSVNVNKNTTIGYIPQDIRSEERRVGKECTDLVGREK